MSSVDGNLSLARLTIPGAHDSGALHEPWPGTAKCQNLTIAEQLNAGVRFLDIRCRHVKNAFLIYHSFVDQKLTFDNVLTTVVTFLTNNPSETVLMSVQEEYTPMDNTRSFEATFDAYVAKYPGKWLLGGHIPTLNNARGKIVLFRRFRAVSVPKGINTSNWADNSTFTNGNLCVQNDYTVSSTDAKWIAIRNMLTTAQKDDHDMLCINFASGFKIGSILPDIPAVADVINPRLANYFASQPKGHYGVILMDFVNPTLCSLVYSASP